MRNGETQSDVSTLERVLRTGSLLVYGAGYCGSIVSRHQHSADVGDVSARHLIASFILGLMRLHLWTDRFPAIRLQRSKNFRLSRHARLPDTQLVG
jgi:hypothetical protein